MLTFTSHLKRRIAEFEARAEAIEQQKDSIAKELGNNFLDQHLIDNLKSILDNELILFHNIKLEINELRSILTRRVEQNPEKNYVFIPHVIKLLREIIPKLSSLEEITEHEKKLLVLGRIGECLVIINKDEIQIKEAIKTMLYGPEYLIRKYHLAMDNPLQEERHTKVKHVYISPIAQLSGILGIFLIALSSYASTYTVKPGDNLSTIAKNNSTTVQAIVRENNLSDPDQLKPGQQIKIPTEATSTVEPVSPPTMQFPLKFYTRVSSLFGPRTVPYTGFHNGIDIAAPTGTQIYPIAPGKVLLINEKSQTAGKLIVIDHNNGYMSEYMHLSNISVKAGQNVGYSTIIGATGDTGKSYGPHLHLGIFKGKGTVGYNARKSNFIDPMSLIWIRDAIARK